MNYIWTSYGIIPHNKLWKVQARDLTMCEGSRCYWSSCSFIVLNFLLHFNFFCFLRNSFAAIKYFSPMMKRNILMQAKQCSLSHHLMSTMKKKPTIISHFGIITLKWVKLLPPAEVWDVWETPEWCVLIEVCEVSDVCERCVS